MVARLNNPNWLRNWPIRLLADAQLSYYLLLIGTHYLYKLSNHLSDGGNESKSMIKSSKAIVTAVILYGIISYPLEPLGLGLVSDIFYRIDLYVLAYQISVLLPTFYKTLKLKKNIDPNHKLYDNINNIILMLFFLKGVVVFYVAETIWGIFSGEYYNIFTFIATFMSFATLLAGNRGFYKN